MPRKRLRLSKSSIGSYLDCPRAWYYSHHPEIPKMVDYPRLCGKVVHSFVKMMYRRTAKPRPFYFLTLEGALGSWNYQWWEAVREAKALDRLLLADEDQEYAFAQIGRNCIENYWKANFSQPRPKEIEQVYYGNLSGVNLIGIFDQVRTVSLQWVKFHRPELVEKGRLIEPYDPVVIMDLKTDYLDYDAARFKKEPTVEEWVRTQYSLHEDVQATLYTYLYFQKTGRLPVAFWWWHMRSGRYFTTFRGPDSFGTLAGQIRHVYENISQQSFPKHSGRQCLRCDSLEPCNENRCFMYSQPETLDEGGEPELVEPVYEKDKTRQLKLKVQAPRQVQDPPIVLPASRRLLHDLPWDDSEESPIRKI